MMALAKRTIKAARADTRCRRASYDYRSAIDPARPSWSAADTARTEKRDGDIEITSRGTFIWQDGVAVPYRRAGA